MICPLGGGRLRTVLGRGGAEPTDDAINARPAASLHTATADSRRRGSSS
jgi:hypothetical protein